MSAESTPNVLPWRGHPREPMTSREMLDYLAGLKIAVALGLRDQPMVIELRSRRAR